METSKVLNWSEVSRCPESPGIYAWYFRPELTDHDIHKLIENINSGCDESMQVVEDFFHERLFKYFRQKPYKVKLSGSLKPNYEGNIEHIQKISSGLIERIIEKPDRLFAIRDLLQKSTPMFASPLYVGMSKNLKYRISQHCNFIKQLRERSSNPFANTHQFNITDEERNFAERVVEKELPSSRLFLTYQVTDSTDENIYVDLENIINRIYYPTFGRN
jgi:hypothetical protein